MALPWDPDKIKENLAILAKLQAGDKFQYLDSGKVRINANSFLRRSRDSISGGRAYEMTEALFSTAVRYSKQGGENSRTHYRKNSTAPAVFVSIREIQAAQAGLERLSQTYATGKMSGDRLAKSQALQKILNRVRGIVSQGLSAEHSHETAVLELHQRIERKYKSELLVGINQHQLLGIRELGMCALMVTDWARRMLISGKTGFESKSWFRSSDDVRMQRKMDDRLRPITSGYLEFATSQPSGWIPHPIQTANVKINPRLNRGYDRLFAMKVEEHGFEEGFQQRSDGAPRQGEGGKLWATVLEAAKSRARKSRASRNVFHIEIIGPVNGGSNSSHTLGFEIDSNFSTGHFFDPNFGEYRFNDMSGLDRYCGFFDDLWRYYAVYGLAVNKWRLFHWYKVAKRERT